jgi:apolipoprotein N-acyltransferase
MDSNRNRWLAIGAVATLASAVCFWFGTGLHPLWWLTWFAPLPVLLLSTRVRASAATASAFLAVLFSVFNQWHYAHDLIRLPLPILLISALVPAVIFTLITLLYRRLALRGRPVAAMLSVPLAWTSIFFGNAMTSPHGTWGDVAYTQMDALPVIQVAALTGLWGIGFTVMLAPAWLAALSMRTVPFRAHLQTAVLGAALLALTLGYGVWRLHDDGAQRTVKVGLASLPGGKPLSPADADGAALIAKYLAALGPLADAGAQYAVIPEVSLGVTEPDVPALREFAQQRGITLVAGVDLKVPGTPERNASLAFAPNGNAPTVYVKHHLVPVFEDRFTPGSDTTLLGDTRVGLTICKDNDFPTLLRDYGEHAAQLLLIPAWDFQLDGWLHSRMAILRGVESGFSIARSARDGRLTLSDDRGRVLAESSSEDGPAQLVGELPLRDTHTLYARWGDWFAWLCVAGLVIVFVRALQRPS